MSTNVRALGHKNRTRPEKRYRVNELYWDKGISRNHLKRNYKFSEVLIDRELFITKEEWQKFKETFTGVLNPEGMR